VVDRDEEADEQGEAGQDTAGDQRQAPSRRGPLAEVGEDVETRNDAEDDDGRDIERGIPARGQERQVFAGEAGTPPLPSRTSMSCWTRSIGTGNTITVFRSTPISVRVCR
jgi:hypothetical protein